MEKLKYKFITERGLRFTADVTDWDDMDEYLTQIWQRKKSSISTYSTPNNQDIVLAMRAKIIGLNEGSEYALWCMLMSHVYTDTISHDWIRVMDAGVAWATGGWDVYAKRHTHGRCFLSVEMQDHPTAIDNEDDKGTDFTMVTLQTIDTFQPGKTADHPRAT